MAAALKYVLRGGRCFEILPGLQPVQARDRADTHRRAERRNLMARQDLSELGFRAGEERKAGGAEAQQEAGRADQGSQGKRRTGFVAGLPSR